MPLRIKLNFTIDDSSVETRAALMSLVGLAELSGFMRDLPYHMGVIKNLASGRGIDHKQVRDCSTEEYRNEIIKAAEEDNFPRGDMREVEEAMELLANLFDEEMMVDHWATIMFRKYAHHGGMNGGLEKQS